LLLLLLQALGSRMSKYAAEVGPSRGGGGGSISPVGGGFTTPRKRSGSGGSPPPSTTTMQQQQQSPGSYLEFCRFLEVQYLQKLLSYPEPSTGYYLSKSWASNYRR